MVSANPYFLGGNMALDFNTPWVYDTSSEEGSSVWVFTGGKGILYFNNEVNTNEKLVVKYSYLSAGTSKGALINIAESLVTDPSSGFSNVKASSIRSFGKTSFPCVGWIVSVGATAGVFQPSFMSQSGLSLAVFLFGFLPFAGIPVWGRFNSILPSAGPSAGFCTYNSDSATVASDNDPLGVNRPFYR
jgi:hypothetical protein